MTLFVSVYSFCRQESLLFKGESSSPPSPQALLSFASLAIRHLSQVASHITIKSAILLRYVYSFSMKYIYFALTYKRTNITRTQR